MSSLIDNAINNNNLTLRIIELKSAEDRNSNRYISYLLEYSENGQSIIQSKRFNEFYVFYRYLQSNHPCLPLFPPKSFIIHYTGINHSFIQNRFKLLNEWLSAVCKRRDIIRTGILKEFISNNNIYYGKIINDNNNYTINTEKQTDNEDKNHNNTNTNTGEIESGELSSQFPTDISPGNNNNPNPILIDSDSTIDIDIVAESKSNEKLIELRDRQYSKQNKPKTVNIQTQTDDNNLNNPHIIFNNPIILRSSITPLFNIILLQFVSRSPVFSINRILFPSFNYLFLSAGDNSKFSKFDIYMNNIWKTKNNNYNVSHNNDSISHPLGCLYGYYNKNGNNLNNQPPSFSHSFSLFFHRELTDIQFDYKRQWIYISTDSGTLHIYQYKINDNNSNDNSNVNSNDDSPIPIVPTKILTVQLHSTAIIQSYFNSINDSLYTISIDGECKKYNITNQIVTSNIQLTNKPTSMIYAENRNLLFITTTNNSIYAFNDNNKSFQLLYEISNAHISGGINCCCYSPYRLLLATGGINDKTVKLWNIYNNNNNNSITLIGHESSITALSFSNDSNYLASGDSNGCVCIWEITENNNNYCIYSFQAHSVNTNVNTIYFNGNQLLTGGNDKTSKLWILELQELQELQPIQQ